MVVLGRWAFRMSEVPMYTVPHQPTYFHFTLLMHHPAAPAFTLRALTQPTRWTTKVSFPPNYGGNVIPHRAPPPDSTLSCPTPSLTVVRELKVYYIVHSVGMHPATPRRVVVWQQRRAVEGAGVGRRLL